MRKLMTSAGEALSGVPWNAYPRPQMVRKDWLCLNGTWSFVHGDTRAEIRVPFCPESLLSGLGLKMEYGREMVYSRSFTLPEEWRGKRILLHFYHHLFCASHLYTHFILIPKYALYGHRSIQAFLREG